ncbi:TPA: hypothetical protein ACSP0J_004063 [Aeromonas veronii]
MPKPDTSANPKVEPKPELEKHGLDGLQKSAPEPVPKKTAEHKRIELLEKEIQRLRKQLEVKEGCLMLV